MAPSFPLLHHYNAHPLLLHKEGHLTIENTTLKGWFKVPQLSHSEQ